ncbi:tyrosine-type recombinase/integrase [Micromonospora echinofusca]|uniref:tyrosine-type recombinase/integrase n=1 Tax=Micromonospora echinofusca TaxID=47858 RepID=UPI0037AB7EF6
MTGSASERLGNNEVEAVRLLLNRLGLTADEILNGAGPAKDVPTFDEYIPHVSLAVAAGTRRVYGIYWRRIGEVWGKRRIDEPSPMEIKQFAEAMKKSVIIRRNSRGGRTAAEHLISALRCLYACAVNDGLISAATNPAARVPKPRRLASTRRALSEAQLKSINEVASSTGNDPQLDALLLRLHEETACRRGGALALKRSDVDVEQCLVRLHEKGETVRWQPISPSLARTLVEHYEDRATDGSDRQVLMRYQNGAPVTRRRYDYLWNRLGKHLPWVATQQISTHWLRHTTLTWVERNFGYGIARAYAGHNSRSAAGTTSTYVKADVYEVARALSALTGEDHPMVAGLPGSLSPSDSVHTLPAIPLRIAEG